MSSESNRPSLALLLTAALLIAMAMLICFYHYGKPLFYQHAPAQLAADVRQMEQAGNWLGPQNAMGQPSLVSAPLYLWAARVMHWFERDLLRASRIPSALCSVLLILLTAWWYQRHATRYSRDDSATAPTEGFAFLAGLMVLASPVIYSLGRDASPASMLAVLYLAAAFCWAESLEARRSFYAGFSPRFWLLWGYVLAGIALLVKGPLALILLWIPYVCAARAYRLRGFDIMHLIGLGVALLIGGWWPLFVGLLHPGSSGHVWTEWLTMRAFGGPGAEVPLLNWIAAPDATPLQYIYKLILTTLPWIILAGAMVLRVLRREDRSPTLVYWAWTLLSGVVVLAFLGRFTGGRLLLLPFIALLATDALYRWDFENAPARVWRIILRVSIILAIILGIFIATWLSAPLWIVIFALIPITWGAWVWHTRRSDVTYTYWETTTRLAAMMLIIVFAALAMLLSKWERRLNFHRSNVSYFQRADDQLDAHDGPAYFLNPNGHSLPGLYQWYLQPNPRVIQSVSQAVPENGQPPVLFATHNVPELLRDPRLEPMVLLPGDPGQPPREGMFRVRPTTDTLATSPTLTRPYHLALLGNAGSRNKNQREVGRRLDRAAEQLLLQDVLLLGNNIYGPGFFDHLDFISSFEEPYYRLLRRGISFHALLGHEDVSYPLLQLNYAPFNMQGRRYYSFKPMGELVEVFMLDGAAILNERSENTNDQLNWFEQAARASTAQWKVVALHPSLLTAANQGRADEDLGQLLLPLFNATGIDLVAWSGGFYYERSRETPTGPLLLNCGWSGNWTRTAFRSSPAHQYGYGEGVAGFVLLEFTPNELGWKAVTRRGLVVDEGRMNQSGEIVFTNEWTRPVEGRGRLLPVEAAAQLVEGASSTSSLTTTGTLDLDPPATATTLRDLDLGSDDAFTTPSAQ